MPIVFALADDARAEGMAKSLEGWLQETLKMLDKAALLQGHEYVRAAVRSRCQQCLDQHPKLFAVQLLSSREARDIQSTLLQRSRSVQPICTLRSARTSWRVGKLPAKAGGSKAAFLKEAGSMPVKREIQPGSVDPYKLYPQDATKLGIPRLISNIPMDGSELGHRRMSAVSMAVLHQLTHD